MSKPKIAIIGAGLAGLSLAHLLKDHASLMLFEKARGVSGRMTTRYADAYQFDHGAQFFTVQETEFKTFLAPLIDAGVIARWNAKFVEYHGNQITSSRQWNADYPHYVGVPKMNQIAKYLAQGCDIRLQTRIAPLTEKQGDGWHLFSESEESLGVFDWVISTAPAEQTCELLPESFEHHKRIQASRMLGCYALMLGFEAPLDLPFDAAVVKDAIISWMAVNSSKADRPEGYSLLVQSTNQWADEHIESDANWVQMQMLAEIERVVKVGVGHANHKALHRWRYANIEKQDGEAFLLDSSKQLAACGDWLIHGRVEAAFMSAYHLAKQLKTML